MIIQWNLLQISVLEEKMEVEETEPVTVTEEKEVSPVTVPEEVPEDKEKASTSTSMLHELYKDDPTVTGRSRQLRCKFR